MCSSDLPFWPATATRSNPSPSTTACLGCQNAYRLPGECRHSDLLIDEDVARARSSYKWSMCSAGHAHTHRLLSQLLQLSCRSPLFKCSPRQWNAGRPCRPFACGVQNQCRVHQYPVTGSSRHLIVENPSEQIRFLVSLVRWETGHV